MRSETMMFDEPTSSPDPEPVWDVLRAVEALVRGGMTTVVRWGSPGERVIASSSWTAAEWSRRGRPT
jgi:energy-coupling factor transporter ATP-binding protein EcfA2